jgi:carbon storage regulator
MLILSRKLNESIVIDGRVTVKVLRIDKDTVKLGIQAPTEMPVHREEIHEVIQRSKQSAATNAQQGATKPNPAPAPAEPNNGK